MAPPRGLLHQGHPDFLNLLWHLPLEEWRPEVCSRLVELPRASPGTPSS